MQYDSERCIPGKSGLELLELEHRTRYVLASGYAKGKRVLDLGSGAGYGSALMGKGAQGVVGVDLSQEAVDFATDCYGSDRVVFRVGDITDPGLPERLLAEFPDPFDVVTCFEVIEHVTKPLVVLDSIRQLLQPNGVLLISTPNIDAPAHATQISPFHEIEYTRDEFHALLSNRFKQVAVEGQHVHLYSAIGRRGGKEIHPAEWRIGGETDAKIWVAICSNATHRIKPPKAGLVTSDEHLTLLQGKLRELRQDQSFKAQTIDHLRQRINALEGGGAAAEYREMIKKLDERMTQAQTSALERSEARIAKLEADLLERERQFQEQTKHLVEREVNLARVDEANKALTQRERDLSGRLDASDKAAGELRQELAQARQEAEATARAMAELRDDVTALEQVRNALAQTNQESEIRLNERALTIERLQSEAAEARLALAETEKRIAEGEERINQLHALLESEAAAAKSALADSENKAAESERRLVEIEQLLAAVEKRAAASGEHAAEMERRLAEREARIAQMESEARARAAAPSPPQPDPAIQLERDKVRRLQERLALAEKLYRRLEAVKNHYQQKVRVQETLIEALSGELRQILSCARWRFGTAILQFKKRLTGVHDYIPMHNHLDRHHTDAQRLMKGITPLQAEPSPADVTKSFRTDASDAAGEKEADPKGSISTAPPRPTPGVTAPSAMLQTRFREILSPKGPGCDFPLLAPAEQDRHRRELLKRPQDILVSIVLPTWNRAGMLAGSIQSVLAQTYRNWELHVVDDGSEDQTEAVVAGFAAADPRIHFHRIDHEGVSAARDTGLRAATGQFVAYVDSDNAWCPDYLLFMTNALRDSGQKCGYCAMRVTNHEENGATHVLARRFNLQNLLKNNYIDINVFMHRRELVAELGGFDRRLRRWVDWDLILRYVTRHEPVRVPVVLCDYVRQKKLNQITLEEPQAFKFCVLNKHLVDWDRLIAEAPDRRRDFVSIVIPVFGGLELTRRCIASIEKNTPAGTFEIVIVENGSKDETRRVLPSLAATHPSLRYVLNYENYMFSLGNNIGVAESLGEYVILLNNDTEVQPGWIEPLLEPLRNDARMGIVGPKLLYPDGTLQCGGIVFNDRAKIPYHIYRGLPRDHPAVNKPRHFQVVTGACMACRAADYLALRGFDPIYMNGGEDLDFCFRMSHTLGKRIYYAPQSEIVHHEAKTEGRGKHIMYNRRQFVADWGASVRPDDRTYYAEDGFEVERYEKPGREPDGDTAAYVPVLRPAGDPAGAEVPASVTMATPRDASASTANGERRLLNIGFSTMWYARGIAFHSLQLAEALEGDWFQTHIFARWESAKFQNGGAIYHPRVFNAGDDPTPGQIVDWARERKLDAMIFMEVHPKDWKRVAALKDAGIRVICYENLDVLRLEDWDKYSIFDGFLFNTFYTRDVMLGRFPDKPSLTIPWGVPGPPRNQTEPGRPDRPLRFVHVAGWGGLNNRKNSDLLIRAFNQARPENAELHFYTQAPLENYGPDCALSIECNSAIKAHVGTIDNILDAYRDMDMLLWPSKREGLGLPIVEALSRGLPALISDGYMMKQWIIPGEHGILCPATPEQGRMFLPEMQVDEEALARIIGELAQDRDRVREMAANVVRDQDLWRWDWQPAVFRNQLSQWLRDPEYCPPDDLSYLPESILTFERRRREASQVHMETSARD